MAYSLTWLPQVLRDAGLEVVEHPGWQTRGHGDMGKMQGVLCHHTGGPLSGEFPDLNVLVTGRPDLAGPLSHLGLGRSGTFYVIAAGKGWHAGAGNWQGVTDGNSHFIGIEAENTGETTGARADPWPEVQMDAYARGCAAILKHIGAKSIMTVGHKEYALPKGRKSDPSFDMKAFRDRVAKIMGETSEDIDMTEPASIRTKNPGAMWGRTGRKPSAFFATAAGPHGVETNAPIPLKWGSTQTIYLSDGLGQDNNIAIFPTWVQGICAQLDLWRTSERYKNKRFADAIRTWSGGNEVASYIAYVKKRVPGITEGTIMNDDFWKGPMCIPFLKAQAGHEAGKQYPAPDEDWIEAQKRVFGGAVSRDAPKPDPVPQVTPAKPTSTTTAVVIATTATAATTTAVAVHQSLNWPAIALTAFIIGGLATAVVLLVRKFREK
jgi:hypothetical protein